MDNIVGNVSVVRSQIQSIKYDVYKKIREAKLKFNSNTGGDIN
jgi:hypothetical protein